MFGGTQNKYQDEKTPFNPQSPYAVAKVYAHNITKIYRDAYDLFACNGILFNHESPLRGETFVTKKIVKALVNIKQKKQKTLYLGNLYSKRDWGHAKDYVRAMWMILSQKTPDDYVIATNKQYTVKEFVNLVGKKLDLKIKWRGKNLNERGFVGKRAIIQIKKRYFRPLEVKNLKGNYSKAKSKLRWKPEIGIDELIEEMINYELINV